MQKKASQTISLTFQWTGLCKGPQEEADLGKLVLDIELVSGLPLCWEFRKYGSVALLIAFKVNSSSYGDRGTWHCPTMGGAWQCGGVGERPSIPPISESPPPPLSREVVATTLPTGDEFTRTGDLPMRFIVEQLREFQFFWTIYCCKNYHRYSFWQNVQTDKLKILQLIMADNRHHLVTVNEY